MMEPGEDPRGRWQVVLAWGLLALVLAAYATVQHQVFTPAYPEVDPDGYIALAKRMAAMQPLAVRDDDIFQHQSHVWVENARGELAPKFAPGYSAILAVFYRLGGDDAIYWVGPAAGLIGLVGCFLLFRLWASPITSALGAAALAANPMFLVYTGYPLTHGLDTAIVAWGMLFLFRWRRAGRRLDAARAGLLLGFACTVRHTHVLLAGVAAVAIFDQLFLARRRRLRDPSAPEPASAGSIAWLIGSYAVGPALLAAYDFALFGSPLVTGYGLSEEQSAFSLAQLGGNITAVFAGLSREMPALTFQAGLLALLVMGPRVELAMRLLWFVPAFLAYASYYWSGARTEHLRFYLFLFPLLVGATLGALDRLAGSLRRRIIAAVCWCALAVSLAAAGGWRLVPAVVSNPGTRELAALGRTAGASLQPDAVIFSRWRRGNAIGSRRDFRYYDLRAFTPRFPLERSADSNPRWQPVRYERLRQFYATHSADELRAMRVELTRGFITRGRQVVMLIPCGTETQEARELGPEFQLTPLVRVAPSGGREWGFFVAGLAAGGTPGSPPAAREP